MMVVALQVAFGTALPVSAQDPAQGLFAGVKALYASSQSKAEADRLEDYQDIRRLLDLIVKDYPSSDIAVKILLQDTIDGVDIGAIDAALEADEGRMETTSVELGAETNVGVAPSTKEGVSSAAILPAEGGADASDAQPPNLPNSTAPSVANASSENALKLDRRAVRDIQARLTVLGHDPNGIDGVIGRGTRAALGRWQSTKGLPQTGYLNGDQLDLLKAESQADLDVWLQEKRNAEAYAPSPKRASSQRGLRNGWYVRNGKYCKRVQFGLQYCTPRRPPDA